ncbi:DUF2683 family protein [Mucilaginibacter myungsuensis]|uniref:Uncharacterized protein n=1 Tax=Mucilaginibacter myungsuensis TaxID=649104 RepID=A0A929L0E8_9SPHI|nr:DUF2683 family protein [Mucilaginibacter myungsuensis]MBE9663293.1 hypothetical protein [Mucilaginibacter myungsuensis]MDN3600028.1 hypothetical protein [Mucilaginibacter myungsuensis]
MDALIVYPENNEQMAALKNVIDTMHIAYQQQEEIYPDYVIEGVKRSLEEAKKGHYKPYTGIKDMLKG